MISGVQELVTSLAAAREGVVLAVFATFPRHSRSGRLEEQGAAVEEAVRRFLASVPSSRAFRVLWSQVVLTAPIARSGDVDAALRSAAKAASNDAVEIRGVWASTTGPRTAEWLDALLGDTSTRGNFGSFAEASGRVIDGEAWPAASA